MFVGADNFVQNEQGALIEGFVAVMFRGANPAFVNHGTVRGMVGAPKGGLDLANTGSVEGDVLSRTDAEDEVHNAGSILGNVMLGNGDDLYDGRGGLMEGIVKGKGGADTILGGDGDESSEGGNGNDLIRAGLGNDQIDGGGGKDSLEGGGGSDNFVFADRGKADKVLDFAESEDSLLLDNAAWKGLGSEGALDASAFNLGGKATTQDHRILYDSETGALKHDANGDKAGGVTVIARLDANLSLGHDHFEII